MADPKPLFEIDAASILAKLHLAGRSQVTYEKGKTIINSGIVDDDASATPEKPGKVKFDFTNKSGKYEVGIVMKCEFVPPFDLIYEDYLTKALESTTLEGDKDSLKKSIESENKKRTDLMHKDQEKVKKEAFEQLKAYFINFVGKENCTKLNVKAVIPIPFKEFAIGDDVVRDFIILPIEDIKEDNVYQESIEKAKQQFDKDAKKLKDDASKLANVKVALMYCFKVGYTSDIETK